MKRFYWFVGYRLDYDDDEEYSDNFETRVEAEAFVRRLFRENPAYKSRDAVVYLNKWDREEDGLFDCWEWWEGKWIG